MFGHPARTGRMQGPAITTRKGDRLAPTVTELRMVIENSEDPIGNYLDKSASDPTLFQQEKRFANFKSVVQKAAKELEDKVVPDQETEHDWTAKFFNSVKDVSSEEMQILWAKILAGQVERPGSSSLRTLGILQEMDRNTAELFEKFCSMCMFLQFSKSDLYDGRVCSLGKNAGHNSLESFGLDFGRLNQLQEYGLITSDYNSYRDYSLFILPPIKEIMDNPPPYH
ncbi:MAG: DUF2806 domain-containing protein [Rhodobacteraceae bacterium]|nr:DUF2806 domain-containing protein [Paracoccaceae bacterium]